MTIGVVDLVVALGNSAGFLDNVTISVCSTVFGKHVVAGAIVAS